MASEAPAGARPAHQFENIGWTVGNFCNARCGHCYSWKVRKDSVECLTAGDVDRVVEQLVRLGVKTVNLGGNEPIYTHGPDIHDTLLPYIIRALRSSDLLVGLTTNGITFTHLDRHWPRELRMLNDIDFSLDSPFESEHNLNRGTKLYKLTIEAIRRSLEIGIDCSVIVCGMRSNFTRDYLSSFLALTRLLGCEFRVNTLKPIEPSLVGEMPTPEQFYEGFAFLMQNSHCITLGESCITPLTGAGGEGCPCGTTSFRINAKTRDGRIPINPCVYAHEFAAGDMLKDDIFDIIRLPEFAQFAGRRKEIPTPCTGCTFAETCRGGCTSRAYLVNGKLDAKDPYCPRDYLAASRTRPQFPWQPPIGCEDGVRVHDNYLCTWIGKVDPDFVDTRYPSVARFLEEDAARAPELVSHHMQAKPGHDRASLVKVDSTMLKAKVPRVPHAAADAGRPPAPKTDRGEHPNVGDAT